MAQQKIVIDEPDRGRAHQIAAALEDLFEPLPQALTLFEHKLETSRKHDLAHRGLLR